MNNSEMKDTVKLTVDEEDSGQRADRYLVDKLEEYSREYIAGLIKENKVLVNGKAIKKNYTVAANDQIDIYIPELQEIQVLPENIPMEILYEDKDVIVVNKPKGMVVHPACGNYIGTLVNALLYHCKDLSGINGALRPGIVHRIDKDTSGILVVAKTDAAHRGLSGQFKDKSIRRIYIALVFGQIEETGGRVIAPIGRDPKDRKRMAVNQIHGKDAITEYKVLERFPKYTLLELELKTGRTHQIRVHMKYLGYPLVGDDKYTNMKNPFNVEGQMLHAGVLGFVHPITGEYLEFKAPLPEYFTEVLNELRGK